MARRHKDPTPMYAFESTLRSLSVRDDNGRLFDVGEPAHADDDLLLDDVVRHLVEPPPAFEPGLAMKRASSKPRRR